MARDDPRAAADQGGALPRRGLGLGWYDAPAIEPKLHAGLTRPLMYSSFPACTAASSAAALDAPSSKRAINHDGGDMPMQLATAPRAPAHRPEMATTSHEDEVLRLREAIDAYKRSSGRMFPTWSEVLEVLRDLGYKKLS